MESDVDSEKMKEEGSEEKKFLKQHGRHISSLTYLVMFILFMFPWVVVSCSGETVETYSGFTLAKLNFGLVIAIILILLGIIVSLVEKERLAYFTGIIISGLNTLVMLSVTIGSHSLANEAVGLSNSWVYEDALTIRFAASFYVVWVLTVGSLAYNWYMLTNYTEGVHKGEILEMYRNSVIWRTIAARADKTTLKSTAEQEVKPKNKEKEGNDNEQENQSN